MSNQILFRGKFANGEWVYGSFVIKSGRWGYHYFIHTLSSDLEESDKEVRVDVETVGQLQNALTERAGFNVFEDDIIQHELYAGLGEPETFDRNFKETVTLNKSYVFYKDIRLLGNIHDNPELL